MELNVLNTKGLAPFVGRETGTVKEYVLNAWHWEAVGSVLVLVAVICFFTSFFFAGGEWKRSRLSVEPMGHNQRLEGGKQ